MPVHEEMTFEVGRAEVGRAEVCTCFRYRKINLPALRIFLITISPPVFKGASAPGTPFMDRFILQK